MKIAGKITAGLLIALETVFAGLFIAPMTGAGGIINIGNTFGAAVMLVCLGATVFRRQLFRLLKTVWSKGWGKPLLLTFGGILGLLVLYALVLTAAMVAAAVDSPDDPDAVIVLGCQVHENGKPSLMLSRRIDAAYCYLSKNDGVICVVSGGQGETELFSEAEVMKSQLVEMGIEEERILIEDKSGSTGENIEFSLVLLAEQGVEAENIAIVTDGFHQLRAAVMAKDMGAEASAVSAVTPLWLLPTYWVREWFALSHLFVFGR